MPTDWCQWASAMALVPMALVAALIGSSALSGSHSRIIQWRLSPRMPMCRYGSRAIIATSTMSLCAMPAIGSSTGLPRSMASRLTLASGRRANILRTLCKPICASIATMISIPSIRICMSIVLTAPTMISMQCISIRPMLPSITLPSSTRAMDIIRWLTLTALVLRVSTSFRSMCLLLER